MTTYGAMVIDVCRGEDVEGDGRGLMCCNILASVQKDWAEPRSQLVRTVFFRTDISTQNLPIINLQSSAL